MNEFISDPTNTFRIFSHPPLILTAKKRKTYSKFICSNYCMIYLQHSNQEQDQGKDHNQKIQTINFVKTLFFDDK